ncbi:hypothetical protein JB92DRAFT_2898206 [Gautieria morchelliformis]|nr:hypothetical protein JB92DRAFT_2898206 [Gautieria morchelliformis]
MMTDARLMAVVESGPAVPPLNYKRAVIKAAPHEFTVEVLNPTKQGNHFSYGVKVCPVVRSRGSSDSRSTSSYSEYEIWRRWEDCLDFQETLEDEYSDMSRQKVKVLKRGAAGKKRNGESDSFYNVRNAAASFESLPEGPDPREVAIDVHKFIPPLTRKASLFRVGRSTVKQRGDEFAAMIQALFNSSEEAPVLLRDLRNCSAVRDFFAVWRRDVDLLKKSGKDVSRLRHSNSNQSMSSLSNFSFMTSSTTPSSPASTRFPRTTSPAALLRHSMFSRTVTDLTEESTSSSPASAPPGSRRFVPETPAAPTYSSTSHERGLMGASPSGSIVFTDELLLQDEPPRAVHSAPHNRTFSHGAATQSPRQLASAADWHESSQPSSIRLPNAIPEDGLNQLPQPQRRPRSNSATTPGYRKARIFVPAPSSALGIAEHPPPDLGVEDDLSSGTSSMSMNPFSVTSSISPYTQGSKRSSSYDSEFSYDSESGIDTDVTLPNSPVIPHTPLSEIAEAHDFEPGHHSRASASSFASFRTQASADGVLPPHLHPFLNSPHDTRVSCLTLPLNARDQSPIEPGYDGADLLDAYFTDLAEGARFSMETLDKELPRIFSHKAKHSISSISSVNSASSTGDPQAPWSPRDDAFVLKAVYHECVIVFRAERTMSLTNVRQRIKERFSLHECIPLDDGFVLGYLPPKITTNGVGRRGRSNSISSLASDLSHLRLLQTEVDWQGAMVVSNGKLTLRVLDPEPQI